MSKLYVQMRYQTRRAPHGLLICTDCANISFQSKRDFSVTSEHFGSWAPATDFSCPSFHIISSLDSPTHVAYAAVQNPFKRPFALEFKLLHILRKTYIHDFSSRPIFTSAAHWRRLLLESTFEPKPCFAGCRPAGKGPK